jgi:polyferredoxin
MSSAPTLQKRPLAFPFHPQRYPHVWLRRLVSHLAILSVLFLGPSVRLWGVDVITQRLFWLGASYPLGQVWFWIPIAFFAGLFLITFSSWLFGRLFCGWVCPHNILTELTRGIRYLCHLDDQEPISKRLQRFRTKTPTWLSLGVGISAAVGVPVFMSFLLASWFVPVATVGAMWQSGAPHIALVGAQGLFTLVGIFLLLCGHRFCKTCCPYGMGQSISAYQGGKFRPMEIQFVGPTSQETDCGPCRACQTVCPVQIDPRGATPEQPLQVGEFLGCWNCGECIDACRLVHPQSATSLLTFKTPYLSPQQSAGKPLEEAS